jgi:hypothetical protein
MRSIVWRGEVLDVGSGHVAPVGPDKIILSNVLAPNVPWDGIVIDLSRTELWEAVIDEIESQKKRLRIRFDISYSDVFQTLHDEPHDFVRHPQMPGLNFVRPIDVGGSAVEKQHADLR